MTNEINNADTDVTTTAVTETAPEAVKVRTWREAGMAALAGLRARLPAVRPMAIGVAIAVVLLGALVGRSQAQVERRADKAAAAVAAEVAALRASITAPAPAPEVGYDGQVAAWARARLDFSAKK